MKIVKFLVSIICVSIVSCASEDEKMTKHLIGNWRTVYEKYELPSYKNTDSREDFAIDYENPEDPRAKERGKSFTTYNADGTFKYWVKKNQFSGDKVGKGKWRATKDSLFWIFEHQPGNMVIVPFGLKLIDHGFALTSIRDIDKDGKTDDTLYLETVRLPDTKVE